MATSNVLESKSSRVGDKVVLTQTVEELYTIDEITMLVSQIGGQRQGILKQINIAKDKLEDLAQKESELKKILSEYEEEVKK